VLTSLVEIDEKSFIKAFDINLFGVYRVNKIFLPLLDYGSRILITTSELAPLSPLPFTGLYAITKSALDKYAYSLRMEVQLLGIKVSVLRPGAVKTDMISASTKQLDDFCNNSTLYKCNAERFKKIVDSVEAKNIGADKIALKSYKIITAKKPRQVYNINRNPLLRLLNILPKRLQTKIIKGILKEKNKKSA
jgi:short-subunit dehydrogenase